MANLNVIEAIRFYVKRMIQDCGDNMKVFVMDKDTVGYNKS